MASNIIPESFDTNRGNAKEAIQEELIAETGIDQLLLNVYNYNDPQIVQKMVDSVTHFKHLLAKQIQKRLESKKSLYATGNVYSSMLEGAPITTRELNELAKLDVQYMLANFKYEFTKRYGDLMEGFKKIGPEHVMGTAPGPERKGPVTAIKYGAPGAVRAAPPAEE